MKKRGPAPKHKRLEDRFLFTIRPRWEILEAIWQQAIFETDKRRRKRKLPKKPITKVNIWCQLGQAGVIARYFNRLAYLDKLPTRKEPYRIAEPTLSSRSLRRNLVTFRKLALIRFFQPSPKWDPRRQDWVKQPNVYEFTYAGVLWIKKRRSSIDVPLVV